MSDIIANAKKIVKKIELQVIIQEIKQGIDYEKTFI